MKLVYVCSPLSGDMKLNQARARVYCNEVVRKGNIPYAPHLLFTQFMNDEDEADRKLALDMGVEMLDRCDEVWAFYHYGISSGMSMEIAYAKEHNKPIVYLDREVAESELLWG